MALREFADEREQWHVRGRMIELIVNARKVDEQWSDKREQISAAKSELFGLPSPKTDIDETRACLILERTGPY